MKVNFGEPDAVSFVIPSEDGKKIGAFPADGGALIVVLDEETDTFKLHVLSTEDAEHLANTIDLKILDDSTEWSEEVA